MKHLTTSTLAIVLMAALTPAIANELNIKTGYVSVFKSGQDTNINKPLFAAGYQADLGGISIILEGGATYGAESKFNNSTSNPSAELAQYTKDADDFQYFNMRVPFKTSLQDKELTFSAGPSLVTYQSTLYSVNAANDGYTPTSSRKFNVGLSTEVTLNLLKTEAFGVDVYSTLPINFHSDFGAGFSFGATLGIDL